MKRFFIFLGMAGMVLASHAQNHNHQMQNAFDQFRKQIQDDFEDFRSEINRDFIEFLRNPWKEFESEEPVPQPKEDPVPPVVMPEEDKDKPVEDNPVVIEDVVKPVPVTPQPQPIKPIEEVPVVEEKTVAFTFFGTEGKVRYDGSKTFQLNGLEGNAVADAFSVLATEAYDNVICDCLALRKKFHLCDWTYLLMLKAMSEKLYGPGTNEATLLMAYVYMQSGYRMRLAHDGQKLYMLYASRHIIYGQTSYGLNGEMYYGLETLPARLYISEAAFPKEQSLSLLITDRQQFAIAASAERTFQSSRYPDFKVTTSVNKNLMDFYNSYPTSYYNDDFMTRWAMYANTPMEGGLKASLSKQFGKLLAGMGQLAAVERLLNLIQTGFVYEYDDKVWGNDRAFFPEETLFYPYCDCEDRSILMTRLVRDLLGLKCILIYYPGHLACAVNFTEDVKGDYIMVGGKKFVVTDPTYIGASVGRTMPDMDNAKAKVILLE
ncbi:MAG: hypothetical protein IJV06_09120 [Bacteroidaceae bacterium]|nr:hypothetical protein [Bacteroidaceae bacterium]